MVFDGISVGMQDPRRFGSGGMGLTGNWPGYDERDFQRDLEDVTRLWGELKAMETRRLRFRRQATEHARELYDRLERMMLYLNSNFS